MKVGIAYQHFGQWGLQAMERLQASGLTIVEVDGKAVLSEQSLIKAITGCTAVIAGNEPYSAKVLDAVPSLKVIARCGIRADGIDLAHAREKNIRIFISDKAHVQSMTEFVLGGLLSLLRGFPEMDFDVRKGTWRPVTGGLLSGKKVGIVGFGRVGRSVAELCLAFGCKVSFHDPFLESTCALPSGHIIYNVPLDELATWSDVLTLHCPLGEGAEAVINDARLKLMPQGAIVVNTSDPKLIDEPSLYAAINKGHLGGAIIDVFSQEPYAGPLLELDGVLLSPHAAAYTAECHAQMEVEAVQAVLETLGIVLPEE